MKAFYGNGDALLELNRGVRLITKIPNYVQGVSRKTPFEVFLAVKPKQALQNSCELL